MMWCGCSLDADLGVEVVGGVRLVLNLEPLEKNGADRWLCCLGGQI